MTAGREAMVKFACIDYGLARTGLAASDPEERMAFPLETLWLRDFASRKDFLAALSGRIAAAGAEAVVMGLPLTALGEDSLSTRQVRNVTRRLQRRLPLPFYFMPEELSSEEAWADLREAGLARRRRKDVLDQQAAVRILASFLELAPERRSRA